MPGVDQSDVRPPPNHDVIAASPGTSHPRSPGSVVIMNHRGMTNQVPAEQLELLGQRGHGVLSTIKKDGRPQLSVVGYAFDLDRGLVRISLTDGRAKTANLRRDPRCSMLVTTPTFRPWVTVEGTAELTPTAADPHDATVEALIDQYRAVAGEHPDWDDYRAAMVRDRRLVLSFTVEHAYGFTW
jgi:PPOX class probable F420-dependent enzyme